MRSPRNSWPWPEAVSEQPVTILGSINGFFRSRNFQFRDAGPKVQAAIDKGVYPKGIKITKAQMATLNLHREEYHGEWNYTLGPQKTV